jgi:hypothetical protein
MSRYTRDQIHRLRKRHRGYIVMLMCELAFLVLLPLCDIWPPLLSVLLIGLTVVLIRLIGRYSLLPRHQTLVTQLGLLAIALELIWQLSLRWLYPLGHWLTLPHVLIWLLFFFLTTLRMIQSLIREPFVTLAVVMGAAQGYLLIGVAGGVLLTATYELHPLAFDPAVLNASLHSNLSEQWGDAGSVLRFAPVLMAASFNLLTTVGSGVMNSGDVTSQVVVTAITVSGQLYVAILIALILGRFHQR